MASGESIMNSPFAVGVEELDRIRAVNVSGELDYATAPELRDVFDQVISSGARSVLVDLSDCRFIDSTGLSVLVHARSRIMGDANDSGAGRLEICCPDPQIRRLLEITGIDKAFGVHDSREEALSALTG